MSLLVMRTSQVVALTLSLITTTRATNLVWDGGGGNEFWGNNSNWDPSLVPDNDDDVTIAGILQGAGPHTVMGANFVIASLSVSNSSEVDTGIYQLTVEGHTQLTGTDTRLQLFERTTAGDDDSLDTDTLSVGSGSFVEMYENSVLEVDSGLFSLFGTLVGNGNVQLNDNPVSPTALLSIFGTLSAGDAGTVLGPPPPRTLDITATDPDARIGMSLAGLIEVQENATLNNEVRMLNDDLENLRLWPNSTYHVEHSWHLGGDITISTGLGSGTAPATLSGGQSNPLLTLDSGSTVTVDFGEQLRFDMQLSANNGSTLANEGTVIFDAPAQFGAMADFQMNGGTPRMFINSQVTIAQNSFDIDGAGLEMGTVRVNEGALLTINVDDFGGGDGKADGTISINSGVLELSTGSQGWIMDGSMTLNNSNSAPAIVRNISGGLIQTLQIGDDSGTSDANLMVEGIGESIIDYELISFRSDADVDIATNSILNLDGRTFFTDSNATFDGAGTLRPGRMTVSANTTFNIAVVDLDANASQSHVLNASLTINADSIDDEGDGFDGNMTITNDLTTDFGELDILLPGGQAASWSFDSGEIRLVGADLATALNSAEMLDGSAIEIGTEGGTLIVEGWVRTAARLDIYGTVSILNQGGDIFVLSGGSQQVPNRLLGGVVEGEGRLDVGSGRTLTGFGTINTSVRGTSNSRLVADDGTLDLNGSISYFSEIEVTDDGMLDVEDEWSTNLSGGGSLLLLGGVVAGERITNSAMNGIRGHGLITAQIFNNEGLRAEGGTLTLDPTDGPNHWHGTNQDGVLHAATGSLILRSPTGAGADFRGTIIVDSAQEVFVENFNLRHIGTGLLELNEGTYRSTGTTLLDASIVVDSSGPSTIQNDLSPLLEFGDNSSITLNQNLVIDASNAVVRSGATTSGLASLVNDRHLTLSDGVGLAVGLVNESLLDVGNEDTDNSLGTVELNSLTQSSSGDLVIDLNGLGTGQFDLLMVNNNAILDGSLTVNLLGSFTPLLGNSWTILTTSLGNVSASNLALNAPIVNDLTLELIVNPQSLVLQVIETSLPGDFDMDGDVDGADFLVWQRNPSVGNLADWQTNYGMSLPLEAASSQVPEPSSLLLVGVGLLLLPVRRTYV